MSEVAKEEGIVSLERLLAYHKRLASYSFVDHSKSHTITKYKSPLTKPELQPPEDIIRSLWGLIDSSFFKEITADELDILNSITEQASNPTSFCHYDEGFEETLKSVFRPDFLRRKGDCSIDQLLNRNWREEMRIHWNFMISHPSEANLQAYRQFQEQREAIRSSSLSEMANKQQELFDHYISLRESTHRLEKELIQVGQQNCQFVNQVLWGMYEQSESNKKSTEGQNSTSQYLDMDDLNPMKSIAKREAQRSILLRYFRYEIGKLEKKQVAQSISKIESKRKTETGNVYSVILEEAMQVGNIELDESELKELNQLRDTSLFQFYQSGCKGKYSCVCHNYLGFDILLHRKKSHKSLLEQPYLFDLLSHSQQEGLSSEAIRKFSKMEACHECKLLYSKKVLWTCNNVASGKQDMIFPTYYDPYIYFLIKQDPKIGETYAEVWRNSLLTNPYKNCRAERVCGRYFCKMCLKTEPTHKCRFCLGTCMCTRCMRNNSIIKLKTLFAILGGDVAELQKESYFAKICSKPTSKKELNVVSLPLDEAAERRVMVSFKMQLEELRLMAYMALERETIKEEQFGNDEAIFRQRLKLAVKR